MSAIYHQFKEITLAVNTQTNNYFVDNKTIPTEKGLNYMKNNSLHSLKVQNHSNQDIELSNYKGKVLLIVNTASACGFTPQYQLLEELYQKYKDQGLEILAFPSNDFGGQEPLANKEIQEFCSINFKVSFPVFQKIVVKGPKAHPLYEFLSKKSLNGVKSMSPKWNFHKYLIDKNGVYVDYFLTTTSPTSKKICTQIEALLKA